MAQDAPLGLRTGDNTPDHLARACGRGYGDSSEDGTAIDGSPLVNLFSGERQNPAPFVRYFSGLQVEIANVRHIAMPSMSV